METDYLKMKCTVCGHEEWAEADIAEKLATYNKKTHKYEIMLMCLGCEGIMLWYQKEVKIETWDDDLI